jgi:hypothetical protein
LVSSTSIILGSQSVSATRNNFVAWHINECVHHQALLISLTRPPDGNDLLGERFTRHHVFIACRKSAPNIPRGTEDQRQHLGRFGIKRCGIDKSPYWHRCAH